MSVLEHWHVSHRITVASPLWPIRNNLDECLRSVDVSLTAYDTAFNQPVKLYVHYKKEERDPKGEYGELWSQNKNKNKRLIGGMKEDRQAPQNIRTQIRMGAGTEVTESVNVAELLSRQGR